MFFEPEFGKTKIEGPGEKGSPEICSIYFLFFKKNALSQTAILLTDYN